MTVGEQHPRLKLPENAICIFQGIELAFDEHWELHEDADDIERKEKRREYLLQWVKVYSELYRKVIPDRHVSCLIETKQQYVDFKPDEIIHVIETIGELANHLYCARRDYLVCNSTLRPGVYYPLAKYYEYALERVVWLVASFNQGKVPTSFTDLKDRMKQCSPTEASSRQGVGPAQKPDGLGLVKGMHCQSDKHPKDCSRRSHRTDRAVRDNKLDSVTLNKEGN